MFPRNINTPKNMPFFLFGARGTGKNTLLKTRYPNAIVVDLLKASEEHELALEPDLLLNRFSPQEQTVLVIDEIQKVPKLLDVVHKQIETQNNKCQFILTGSSARKLKLGGANLLAGRAALRNLYPLLPEEIGENFSVQENLEWGSLPYILNSVNAEQKRNFLVAYAQVYLKEEIWAEQIVRKLEPFRRFLEVAAQQAGKILNYASISRDVGSDPKTVQTYFQILEDTLLGFQIESFHTSIRKRLRKAPKFYFIDVGIQRSLARHLNVKPSPKTSYYGDLFENWFMAVLYTKNDYAQNDYRMSYLESIGGGEVDIVIERPGKNLAFVEIKSTNSIREEHVSNLKLFLGDFSDADFFCVSQDEREKHFGKIKALHWKTALQEI
jgi:uncharacterized protein